MLMHRKLFYWFPGFHLEVMGRLLCTVACYWVYFDVPEPVWRFYNCSKSDVCGRTCRVRSTRYTVLSGTVQDLRRAAQGERVQLQLRPVSILLGPTQLSTWFLTTTLMGTAAMKRWEQTIKSTSLFEVDMFKVRIASNRGKTRNYLWVSEIYQEFYETRGGLMLILDAW